MRSPFASRCARLLAISAATAVLWSSTPAPAAADAAAPHSVARVWDEEILDAIRHDTPRPTVHARNLFHLSAAMWDAWRAYGGGGFPYLVDEYHTSADPESDRNIAISYAAYRLLSHRYALSVNATSTLAHLDSRMNALGLDKAFTDTTGSSPASVGNRIAAAMIAYGKNDGAAEVDNYADSTYSPINEPLVVTLAGTTMIDPNQWQPLALDFFISQNGIPLPDKVQKAIGMRWNSVTPFALDRTEPDDVYVDPGAPPRLGTETDVEYKQAAVRVVELSSRLTPDDEAIIDISPGAYGNNPLGTNAGTGRATNPVTGQPYEPEVVNRGDFGRVLAEFWADGPNSETPPGHWNALANYVTDLTPPEKLRVGASGAPVSALEWDVKLYFALNGAVHDAAIVAWGLKRKYDSARPISMIRYMSGFGQSSDPNGPSYDVRGLPLVPGLVEVITPASAAPGARHEALSNHLGKIAIRAWPGQPEHPATEHSGTTWILGTTWVPYQKKTFVTPAFPGFVSGHSTFSRAAAEILTSFNGSPYFPGGLGEFVAPANEYLTFEKGPTTDVRLQWATYYDAADQAGQSRIWGGIHIDADDFIGRRLGSDVGLDAYEKALQYYAGRPLCGNLAIDDGETCDDGSFDNGDGCSSTCSDETCIAQTEPGYPVTPLCSDGDPCTIDVCSTGPDGALCQHLPRNCDDVLACTSDQCIDGECQHTAHDEACDDDNPCTADTCSRQVGCTFVSVVAACDDGNACTTSDTCIDGICAGTVQEPCCGDGVIGGPETCDDGTAGFSFGEYCGVDCTLVPCGHPSGSSNARPTATDALFALRSAVSQVDCSPLVCDVDGSGKITATDALRILKAAVGQQVALVCPTI